MERSVCPLKHQRPPSDACGAPSATLLGAWSEMKISVSGGAELQDSDGDADIAHSALDV